MVDAPDLDSMSRDEQLALARGCVDRITAAGNVALEESVDEDGNLLRKGRLASGRSLTVAAMLDPDEDCQAEFGDVRLMVELDNRVGCIELVYDEDPGVEGLTMIAPNLFVSAVEAEERAEMLRRVERIGGPFVAMAAAFLREYEEYKLQIGGDWMGLSEVVDLTWDEEDWAQGVPDAIARARALDSIAAMVERVAPESFVSCQYCGARFDAATNESCAKCGAAP